VNVADFLKAAIEKLRRTAEAAEIEANTASVDIFRAGSTIEDDARRWKRAISLLENTGKAIETLVAVEHLTDANREALRIVLDDVRISTESLSRLLQEEVAQVRDRVSAIKTEPEDDTSIRPDPHPRKS
jgi:uncharacterized membrane protein